MLPILINLNQDYGLITIAGEDALSFLQGQLSCDMRDITSTTLNLGATCNTAGRIIALFRIFKKEDKYCLELPQDLLETAITVFKKYGLFSKVSIHDATHQWQRFGVNGLSLASLEHLLEDNQKEQIQILSFPAIPNQYEILGPDTVMQALWQKLKPKTKIATINAWRLTKIRAFVPEIFKASSEQFLPHYLDLPQLGALSFKKGCYRGQEIIARMEYRANIKRGLKTIILPHLSEVPLPGTSLPHVGKVVMACLNEEGSIEILVEAPDINK